MPPTSPTGVSGRLVDMGTGDLRRLDRMDVTGGIVLVGWRSTIAPPSDIGLELGLRGAAGMILTCPAGGPYFQDERALGAFGSAWHPEGPPMVFVCKEDAQALRDAARGAELEVRVVLDAELRPGGPGWNSVGYLEGARNGEPIVVGAHHDGWFRAAFDNASGVAAMLAIARTLREGGHRPRHTICFTSRTAEEYAGNGAYAGLEGAWAQVSQAHPEWAATVPFHLCLEASGHPELPLLVHAPVELARFARQACRAAAREGWLPRGFGVTPPALGTEQWPLLLAGIPSVTVYTWHRSFMKGGYHTPRDTIELLDFDYLVGLSRLYALLVLEADEDPDGILNHRARATQLAKIADAIGEGADGLRAAADRHATRRGRRAFTRVGRGLHALNARHGVVYPHEQAAADAENLEAALDALRRDDHREAVKRLSAVGENRLAKFLSEEAFALRTARRKPRNGDGSWAARSHLTASPALWRELASLRGEPGAPPVGPWLERSLQRHLERSRAETRRRLARMARLL
jgi:hypothetical protein